VKEPRSRLRSIAFRVDASAIIGSGHLRRCLTLAEALRDRGAHCVFVCRAHPDNMNKLVTAQHFDLIELPAPTGETDASTPHAKWLGVTQTQDAAQTEAALTGYGPFSALIVDHYALDSTWEARLRSLCAKLMVIDDLADRPHLADVLVDVMPTIGTERYESLVPAHCHLLLGSSFALLRREFRSARHKSQQMRHKIEHICINFGAVDAQGYSILAIHSVRRALNNEIAIDVIIGGLSPILGDLRHLSAIDPFITLHVDTNDVATIFSGADLAIGACGTTSWERACLGVPTIATAIAANQLPSLAALANLGAILALDTGPQWSDQLVAALQMLHSNFGLRCHLSQTSRNLVDGLGAERLAELLWPIEILMRQATLDDSMDIWHWRNSSNVRQSALSPVAISLDTHLYWLKAALADPNRILLIASLSGQSIGVLRYDLDVDAAEVSIYLTPDGFGRGLATNILQSGEAWLCASHPQVKTIKAKILPGNHASMKAFQRAGYHSQFQSYLREINHGTSY
jgi:UDP-2,4-diacetamido-2,4,6-trideoxy-beta-L-altropyranose hydrolase